MSICKIPIPIIHLQIESRCRISSGPTGTKSSKKEPSLTRCAPSQPLMLAMRQCQTASPKVALDNWMGSRAKTSCSCCGQLCREHSLCSRKSAMKGEAKWGPGLDDHLLQGQNVVTWACALGEEWFSKLSATLTCGTFLMFYYVLLFSDP